VILNKGLLTSIYDVLFTSLSLSPLPELSPLPSLPELRGSPAGCCDLLCVRFFEEDAFTLFKTAESADIRLKLACFFKGWSVKSMIVGLYYINGCIIQ
jgi:hypothetical protein